MGGEGDGPPDSVGSVSSHADFQSDGVVLDVSPVGIEEILQMEEHTDIR